VHKGKLDDSHLLPAYLAKIKLAIKKTKIYDLIFNSNKEEIVSQEL